MGRTGRIAVGLVGAVVLALVLAQLLLPRIAAGRISSRVGRYGDVDSVDVSAWPAVKLLWGDADSVKVKAANLKVSVQQTAKLLREAQGVHELQLTVASAQEGPLRLSDVSLHKRGDAMRAEAQIGEADVKAAVPPGFDVQLLSSEHGQVEVRVSGGLFGVGGSVEAVALVDEGKLVAHPRGLFVEGITITLFDEPHVRVTSVSASRSTDAAGMPGYRLAMTAQLR